MAIRDTTHDGVRDTGAGPAVLEAGTEALTVPRLPRTFVRRRRLGERLDSCTGGGITVLVAPVGAGKTLGVSGWLHEQGQALRAWWTGGGSGWTPVRMAGLLDRAAVPDDEGDRPLVVVDDAHELPAATLQLLDERLQRTPDDLRLILLSRWDLPLSRLIPELHGHLSVLRGDLLRLDDGEAATLVRTHARSEDPEVERAVTAHAQGWCAAVVLTSRAVAASPDPVATALAYSEGDVSVADRLATEVFAGLQPRERHLLLCVAAEREIGVEMAAHLSHDRRAGDVLTGLEGTGLLVTRVPQPHPGLGLPDDGNETSGATYRIHPLLAEAVRRRIAAGGVDVLQAQATVRRAVDLDLARGDSRGAYSRLLAQGLVHEVARLLADQGLLLMVRDRGRQQSFASFARRHPEAVAGLPAVWLVLGTEQWLANEPSAAIHWLQRVADAGAPPGDARAEVRVACARLLLSRLGVVPLDVAVDQAERVLRHHVTAATPRMLRALLTLELGACQNLRGDLAAAEHHLTRAAALGRSLLLPGITAMALSYLALTAYMQGREHAAAEIGHQALELLAPMTGGRPDVIRGRVELARELARMCDLPVTGPGDVVRAAWAGALHPFDALTQFWVWIRDARAELTHGSVSGAEQHLEVPRWGMALTDHLQVVVLVERAFLASLAGDHRTLHTLEGDLRRLDVPGEAALVRGLWHELEGDRKAACAAYGTAAEQAVHTQPPTRALALACRAQLLDVLGEPDQALRHLAEAATLTEVRRNAVPFLGWSRQGTPIGGLLQRLDDAGGGSQWLHQLAESAADRPDVAAVFAPATASTEELSRGHQEGLAAMPTLSPREREVLHELARGATYADIATQLFVSENTVKTHVSNLYAKLVVTRRSEALAVARALHLI